MEIDDERHPVIALSEFADRLDELARTADLMGDEATARHWHSKANEVRLRAMSRLDDD